METSILTQVQNALPALSSIIEKRLGFYPVLSAGFGNNNKNISLESDNLINELGDTLVKTIFTEIKIGFWGGTLSEDGKSIWFNPKISYKHPSGGSNGVNFLCRYLIFNLETNEWIEGDYICEVKG